MPGKNHMTMKSSLATEQLEVLLRNRPGTLRAVFRSRLAATLVAVLAGGSLLGTCQARFREAAISGSKCYFFGVRSPGSVSCDSLFDPTDIVDSVLSVAGDAE